MSSEKHVNGNGSGPAKDPAIGRTLAHWRVEERIGRGSMASVYKGSHVELKAPVAIKIVRVDLLEDRETLLRFQQEARTLARLNSPYIVRVNHVGFDPALAAPFIVMEYVAGGSLKDYVEELPNKRMGPDEACRYLRQASLGINEARRLGIVHRDIKPDNLLLGRDKTLKISDFGIAKMRDSNLGMTDPGKMLGTPIYASPEQCKGQELDFRSDMYSLGASFYYLLTGHPPTEGSTHFEVIESKTKTDYLDLHEALPEIDIGEPICDIIKGMTMLDVEDRYASIDALVEDCDRVQRGEPSIYHQQAAPTSSSRFSRFLFVVLLLAGLGYSALTWGPEFLEWANLQAKDSTGAQLSSDKDDTGGRVGEGPSGIGEVRTGGSGQLADEEGQDNQDESATPGSGVEGKIEGKRGDTPVNTGDESEPSGRPETIPTTEEEHVPEELAKQITAHLNGNPTSKMSHNGEAPSGKSTNEALRILAKWINDGRALAKELNKLFPSSEEEESSDALSDALSSATSDLLKRLARRSKALKEKRAGLAGRMRDSDRKIERAELQQLLAELVKLISVPAVKSFLDRDPETRQELTKVVEAEKGYRANEETVARLKEVISTTTTEPNLQAMRVTLNDEVLSPDDLDDLKRMIDKRSLELSKVPKPRTTEPVSEKALPSITLSNGTRLNLPKQWNGDKYTLTRVEQISLDPWESECGRPIFLLKSRGNAIDSGPDEVRMVLVQPPEKFPDLPEGERIRLPLLSVAGGPFLIDQTEVTYGDLEKWGTTKCQLVGGDKMDAPGYGERFGENSKKRPVVALTYGQALVYAKFIPGRTLPTVSQWLMTALNGKETWKIPSPPNEGLYHTETVSRELPIYDVTQDARKDQIRGVVGMLTGVSEWCLKEGAGSVGSDSTLKCWAAGPVSWNATRGAVKTSVIVAETTFLQTVRQMSSSKGRRWEQPDYGFRCVIPLSTPSSTKQQD